EIGQKTPPADHHIGSRIEIPMEPPKVQPFSAAFARRILPLGDRMPCRFPGSLHPAIAPGNADFFLRECRHWGSSFVRRPRLPRVGIASALTLHGGALQRRRRFLERT